VKGKRKLLGNLVGTILLDDRSPAGIKDYCNKP